jgi:hypothetical protein
MPESIELRPYADSPTRRHRSPIADTMVRCTPSSPAPADLETRGIPSGLHFDCDAPVRPGFRVELAVGRRIRVVSGAQVLLHARPGPTYRGVTLLRAADAAASPLPPLGPRDVAAVSRNAEPGDATAWLEAWARYLVRLFDDPAARASGPLHRGTWRIEPLTLLRPDAGPPPGHRAVFAPDHDPEGFGLDAASPLNFESWWLNGSCARLPLRAQTAPDAARVKALRKLALAGTLPPLVLLFVTGLDMYLLLDGHDRLRAALLEGQVPTALALSRVRYFAYPPEPRLEAALAGMERALEHTPGPATVDRLNRSVLALFAEGDWRARTRCWPVPGGAGAWDAEVAARLHTLGLSGAPEAAGLLG